MTEHYIKLNDFLYCNFLVHKLVVRGYFKIHRNRRGEGLHWPSGSVSRMKTSWKRVSLKKSMVQLPHTTQAPNCGLATEA